MEVIIILVVFLFFFILCAIFMWSSKIEDKPSASSNKQHVLEKNGNAEENARIEKKRQQIEKMNQKRQIKRQQVIDYLPSFIAKVSLELKDSKVFQRTSEQEWLDMSPLVFEHKVGDVFRRLGYRVAVTQASSDGGIDIIAINDSGRYFIQCKHYGQTNLVGVKELREFFGVCMQYGVTGYFVYTSALTKAATEFVQSESVAKVLTMVPTYKLMAYDRQGSEQQMKNTFSALSDDVKGYLEAENFLDCGYYALHDSGFRSFVAAQNYMYKLKSFDGIEYAIRDYEEDSLKTRLYCVIAGSEEAINQLQEKDNRSCITFSKNFCQSDQFIQYKLQKFYEEI